MVLLRRTRWFLLRACLVLLVGLWSAPPAAASLPPAPGAPGPAQVEAEGAPRVVARRKKKKRKKKGAAKRKKRGRQQADDAPDEAPAATPAQETPVLDASGAPPADGGGGAVLDLSAPPPDAAGGAVLDLSAVDESDEEAARDALLQGEQDQPTGKKKPRKKGGAFDFGGGFDMGAAEGDAGGEFEFGIEDFDLGTVDVGAAEQDRFDEAIGAMSDENYATAAQEFHFFLGDPKFKAFQPEAEYQLAKALYKLGLYDSALKRFRAILEQGASHRRYRKAVEWLFFIARKMADETEVLALLAQFRNVKFPKAYQQEYRYLLSKYLFVQAERFEVDRLRESQLTKSKALAAKMESQGFNFDEVGAMDFGGGDLGDAAGGALDFSAMGGGEEAFEFSGGGFDFEAGGDAGGGGGFDFSGGGDAGGGDAGGGDAGGGDAGGGSGFDFGSGGGGFDFGGPGDAGGTAAAGADEKKPAEDSPVREQAPTTAKEAVRQGLDLIAEVPEEGKFGPKARYLRALLEYMDATLEKRLPQEAVKSFLDVVRMLNPRESSRLDPELRESGFLSLARIHYGARQFDRSAYYYDLIDRDSESWLTALFEASWAYYRRGDYEKALGNLLTLHSPFFEKEYFPESQIVKAIIYFEACRYDETREIVDGFLERYTTVMKEIQTIAKSEESAAQLYSRIKTLQSLSTEEEDEATIRVVNLALGDPQIKRAREVVKQTEEELALWNTLSDDFRTSKIGRELLEELKALAITKENEAGEVTRRVFEEALYELKGLLAQALRIKIEVVRAERRAIEDRLKGIDPGDTIVAAEARTVVDDEHLYWPYEGEYWRDELGTYQLDFSMCRSLAAQ